MKTGRIVFWIVIFLVSAVVGILGNIAYQDYHKRINNINSRIAAIANILGFDGKYDFNNNLLKINDFNRFLNYKVYVETEIVLEIPEELRKLNPTEDKKDLGVYSEAPAIIIGRYALTASHVNDSKSFSRRTMKFRTPLGVVEAVYDFKVLKHDISIIEGGSKSPLKEIYRDRERDFALFETIASRAMPDDGAPNFPFKIGRSGELKVGHFVYINGRPQVGSEVARPGNVTALKVPILIESSEVEESDRQFSISQSTDKGDSGSPIMAFRDGKPELVGIYLGWVGVEENDNGRNTHSRAVKIDIIADEIKNKLGIDLRQIQHQTLN